MDHQLLGGPAVWARSFPPLLVPASFLHYWSRRLVVAYMFTQMRFLLARQKERDPCFSYVSDAALHLDNCDAHMPGGPSCDGTSNRGLRRDAAAFPTSRLSV